MTAPISSSTPNGPTGWWNPEPYLSRSRWHFIGPDGRSLCGKYLYVAGPLDQGEDNHPQNCRACVKKKQREAT